MKTPAERIARAAHLFGCFYGDVALAYARKEGLSDDEIHAGADLAERDRMRYLLGCRIFGDPAWGSWPQPYAKEILFKEIP